MVVKPKIVSSIIKSTMIESFKLNLFVSITVESVLFQIAKAKQSKIFTTIETQMNFD